MKKYLGAAIIMVLILVGCAQTQKQAPNPQAASPDAKKKDSVTIGELKQAFQTLRSDSDRRNVCLRAIDNGFIRRGQPVSNVDEIFGTTFSRNLPPVAGAVRQESILLAKQPVPEPLPPGVHEGGADIGWWLGVDYDSKGEITNYYLSNLHKTGSRRTDGKTPMSISELQQRYQRAKSESERRDVCLLAIDEGVIQTFGPVKVSTVDEIFGTHLTSALPSKHEIRKGRISFAAENSAAANSGEGWALVVEYYDNGAIDNYYVTNVPG